jgi:protein-L-isoaspartate(D-aspartate) O-methyltransferase
MILPFKIARKRMVNDHLIRNGISNRKVLAAMRELPRHLFVSKNQQTDAYSDRPLPIGHKQTISQPSMVARMTETLELDKNDRVLEIGTGSGYQTAILAMLAAQVYTIEKIPALYANSIHLLEELGFTNITFRLDDGTLGWPEHQYYDAIIVCAGAPQVPDPLIRQLAPGGRMVIPIGDRSSQNLLKIKRTRHGLEQQNLGPCRFVALVGIYGW